VNQDIRTLEVVRNWKNAALSQNEWTQLLNKAKAYQGLLRQLLLSLLLLFCVYSQFVALKLCIS
jgi:hypothetical protein